MVPRWRGRETRKLAENEGRRRKPIVIFVIAFSYNGVWPLSARLAPNLRRRPLMKPTHS